jgi:ribosomal protein S18 acetylase RimI-like enzyme
MSLRLKIPTLEHAAAALTLAFSADPPSRWVFADPHDYLTHFPEFVRALGGRAFEHNTADSLEGCAAVALWLPPGVEPDEEAMNGLMQRAVPESFLADAFAVFEQMSGFHPQEPHWYLPLIGVDPARQGAGHGTELMRHALRRCDADHKLAYLESSNPRNTPFYERLGFERLGVIQAGTSPQIVPMLRKPR